MSTSRYFFVIGCVLSFALGVRAQGNTSQDSMLTLIGAWTTGHCEAVATDSKYVYIAKGSTVEILDLSNSASPQLVGRLLGDADIFQIAVSGNHAYLAREYRGASSRYGLSIVDIANPRSPRETAIYELGWAYSQFQRVCASGDLVYVPFARYSQDTPSGWYGWLGVIDASNPAAPRDIGKSDEFQGRAGNVYVSGECAYVSVELYPKNGLKIFDIKNPAYPVEKGFCEAAGEPKAVSGNRLYTAHNDELTVFDITTPSQPNKLGTCGLGHYILHAVASGGIAYATHDSLLSVIDVSDSMTPCKIAEELLDDHPRGLSLTTRHLYVAGLWNGLHILDLGEPRLPVQENTYRTGRRTYDFCVDDQLALITHQERGLSIVDIRNPSFPQTLTYYPLDLIEARIHVEGEFAYVVGSSPDWSTGYLVILDIGDPTDPQEVGRLDLGGWASDIGVADYNAYIVLHNGGLKIIDADDPMKPMVLGFCQALPWGNSILVQGRYAYVAGALGGWIGSFPRLCIVDIDDSSKPMVYGIFDGGYGGYSSVSVSGNHAFVTGGWSTDISYGSWLDIIDIGVPHRPERACEAYRFENSTSVAGLHVSEEHAYCAIRGRVKGNGLEVLDTKDLSNIHRVAQFATSPARGVTVSNGFVHLLAEDGLYLLQSNLPTRIDQESDSPTAFSLHQNYPNPFNLTTTIRYDVAGSGAYQSSGQEGGQGGGHVRMAVYDLLGREVAVLVDEKKDPGSYEVQFDAKRMASGVYLYRFTAGSFAQSCRMIFLR